MSVVEAVARDIAKMPEDLRDSGFAASALALAAEMDNQNSATSKSMCARELRETLDRLRELAPPARKKDALDELAEHRRQRRGQGSAGA